MAEREPVHDIRALLFTSERDHLLNNNGDKVTFEGLEGKTIGLYFSASWCGPCRNFTPLLVDAYTELAPQSSLEIVFLSNDSDEESFNQYFSKMPWLAVPFSDSESISKLNELFSVNGIPHLVFLSQNGEILSENGFELINTYGSYGYPFTGQKIEALREQDEEQKRNPTLQSLLATEARDYLIGSDGRHVPVSDLEGKTVGLYISDWYSSDFSPSLAEAYNELKEKGEAFEIVMIVTPRADEEFFKEAIAGAPWLALPFRDRKCYSLIRWFDLPESPIVAIIGSDGKTLNPNVAEAIEDHGSLAFPFTPQRFSELREIERAKEESQTLESLLVSGEKDFVIQNNGSKISVSSLVGKTVLLYFSAQWCPPCRAFLPKLISAYEKIRAKESELEVIFISSDRDESSFGEFFGEMPWLALPFGDDRKMPLKRKFKVQGIPTLIAIGPSGRTVSKDARNLVACHGAKAYPFTEERIKEIENETDDMMKAWPKRMTHKLHEEHELVLTRRCEYECDSCGKDIAMWSFCCGECDFDIHPDCALEDDELENDELENDEQKDEKLVCEGDVCHRE